MPHRETMSVGESHFYLGRRHLLKVHHQPDAPETVRMLRGRLEVSVQDRSALRLQKLLELWYFKRTQEGSATAYPPFSP